MRRRRAEPRRADHVIAHTEPRRRGGRHEVRLIAFDYHICTRLCKQNQLSSPGSTLHSRLHRGTKSLSRRTLTDQNRRSRNSCRTAATFLAGWRRRQPTPRMPGPAVSGPTLADRPLTSICAIHGVNGFHSRRELNSVAGLAPGPQPTRYPRSPKPMIRSVPPPLVHRSLKRLENRSGSGLVRPIL